MGGHLYWDSGAHIFLLREILKLHWSGVKRETIMYWVQILFNMSYYVYCSPEIMNK